MPIIPFPLPSPGEFSDCGPTSLLTGSYYLPRVFIIRNTKPDNDCISKSSGLSRQMWPSVFWEICGMCDIPVKCGRLGHGSHWNQVREIQGGSLCWLILATSRTHLGRGTLNSRISSIRLVCGLVCRGIFLIDS